MLYECRALRCGSDRRFANCQKTIRKDDRLPGLPSYHALAVLALIVLALYSFSRDRYPLQTTGFAVLLLLSLGSYLFPYPGLKPTDFLANFGDDALVTICCLLAMVKGLEVTGALRPLTVGLARVWEHGPRRALLVTLIAAALASGFINDTPLMSILLPVLIACAMRGRIAPSRVLLPLNYAVLIGGMATTIGTSTNLLGVGVARDLGVGPFYLFDLTPPVIFAGILGLAFVWLAAPLLLPDRKPLLADTAPRLFSAALYINQGGYADGRTLADILVRTHNQLRVDRIQRGEDFTVASLPSMKLQAGDRLYVQDTAEQLKEFERLLGATLYNASDFDRPVSEQAPLDTEGQQLAEVVITRASPLYQRVLDAAEFLARYRLLPLAIHRGRVAGMVGDEREEMRLRAGDVILVQGTPSAVTELRAGGSMLVLDGAIELPHTDRAVPALLIMIAVVISNATGLVPITVGALLGFAAMLLTRCLRWRHIGEALNINLVMVIVASLCLGMALIRTGAADFLAQAFVAMTRAMPIAMILGTVMLAVTALANVVTNNAAVVISVPVAVGIAQHLGVSEEAFVLAVIYGANMPFVTSFGYQTNAMIMSPAGYEAADYRRIGVPLTAIMLPALTYALARMYGL
jgi:di/tricarboxylate transporter